MLYDFETLVDRSNKNSKKWKKMHDAVEIADSIPPFSVADYDFEYPPQLKAGFRKYAEDMIFGYSYAGEKYYDSFISWVEQRHKFKIEREWILDGNGVVSSIDYAINAFTKESDGIIIMPPVYPPFIKSVNNNKRSLVECPLINRDGYYEMDFDLFEKLASKKSNKMLVFCSPHNPVGRVWKKTELEKLSKICSQNNILVISDEIHMDVLLNESQHHVYGSISKEALNNSILLTSASKSFNLAGCRSSMVIIANKKLRNQYFEFVEKYRHVRLNAFGFKLYELAYSECEDWFDEFLFTVENNYKTIEEYLSSHHPQIKISPMEGTYLTWLDCRKLNLSDEELFDFFAKDCQIFSTPGEVFGIGGSGFIRLNIALPQWTIEEALKRLTTGLRKFNL